MITITFAGLPISAYQEPKLKYPVNAKAVTLLSGDIHVSLSSSTKTFPRTYDCYTADYSEITDLAGEIGSFDTLVISGTSYTDCYIAGIDNIYEVVRGSGKWTFTIEFGQADQH